MGDSFLRLTGPVKVRGELDVREPHWLVLPLTVEPSKPRLCVDARFLGLEGSLSLISAKTGPLPLKINVKGIGAAARSLESFLLEIRDCRVHGHVDNQAIIHAWHRLALVPGTSPASPSAFCPWLLRGTNEQVTQALADSLGIKHVDFLIGRLKAIFCSRSSFRSPWFWKPRSCANR